MTEFPSLNLAEMEELLDIENLSLYFNCSDRKVLTNSIKIRGLIIILWADPLRGLNERNQLIRLSRCIYMKGH